MTTVDEKEILEIEKLKADFKKVVQDLEIDNKRLDLEMRKTSYDAWKLAFYGVAVGAGATFAIAKTVSLMG
ncbi:MAG: hypothetical protein OIF32_10970 [Campylobacterales bacterium]|nr:hypothetical protein [Campylobacterales bacterium]